MSTLDLEFQIADGLVAHEPVEARGLRRNAARLMVSCVPAGSITHTPLARPPDFLGRGDLLVVNASAKINAALRGMREPRDGERQPVLLHLSAPVTERRWVVEVRRLTRDGHVPLLDGSVSDRVVLAAGATARLVEPYLPIDDAIRTGGVRLWVAELTVPGSVLAFAERYGAPIRYQYVRDSWPLSYYQTLWAREPGSAEMPSAGRAFTPEVVGALVRKGVRIAPLILHTGVSSLEADEPPYPERYRVSAATARAVNDTRAAGGRVVAVGTTVVRALETVARDDGAVRPGSGWTDLVITPERGVRAVDGLLTGLHAPDSTHLAMLRAIAPTDHLRTAYDAAQAHRYLWHEFGDLHLVLP